MIKRVIGAVAMGLCVAWAVVAGGAETPLLEDEGLQDKVRALGDERNEQGRLGKAKSIVAAHRLSSLQIKAIAARLGDDSARFEFALAAYPRTIDPENFYEVYDAFRTFSKVMRLHDQIRPPQHSRPGPVPVRVHPPTEEEMESILKALRKEDFDRNRIQLARQILTSGGRKFLSSQVRRMVELLDFDNGKLELAKFAYDFTLDQEQYFVVNEAFDFGSTRENLSKYIEGRQKKRE